MIIVAWVLLLAILAAYFQAELDQQRNPNREVVARTADDGASEVVLERNRAGHYVSSGLVNGQRVEFMLDTGATDVSIPERVAARLGLEKGAPVRYRTANGEITAWLTRLDSVAIGPIELRDVRASINPGQRDGQVLLGMSVLKRLEFTQRGDTLILRPYR